MANIFNCDGGPYSYLGFPIKFLVVYIFIILLPKNDKILVLAKKTKLTIFPI